MLFADSMSRRKVYSFGVVVLVVFIASFFQDSSDKSEEFSGMVKVSLRDIGNQLLLANQDSSSLVLPIVESADFEFELSFQSPLSFEPSRLVSIIKNSFRRASLPENYIVEVVQCADKEIAYSYRMTTNEQTTIIPCTGRMLPKSCYTIEVKFTNDSTALLGGSTLFYLLILILFVLITFLLYNRRRGVNRKENKDQYTAIGSFQFYPEQNKLVKAASEIGLSRKECELLTIFVANPNQVVKRDELTKRVWEDNGVIVGRSLDTYISKLRTKLKEDDTIKLANVHGVGYKLEINH